MKKSVDLKKLALLGITGGVMLTAQLDAKASLNLSEHPISPNTILAAGGCPHDDDDDNSKDGKLFAEHEVKESKTGGACAGASGCGGMDKDKKGSDAEEEAFLSELSFKGRETYNSLNAEGKELARTLAGRSCAGHNECKGLNSCESDDNKCAGQGSCKGTSKCSFHDTDQAVDVAAEKMADKRADLEN